MFHVRGLSIINGAQTVGAIAKEPIAHYDANPAMVMATFVCLDNAPDGFTDQCDSIPKPSKCGGLGRLRRAG